MSASQKKHSLPKLCLIADTHCLSAATQTQVIRSVVTAGVGLIQFRDKRSSFDDKLRAAEALQALCSRLEVPLLINDDVDIARAVGAAGAHLGREDMPIDKARGLLGKHAIIGASCYASLECAQQACRDGADYVSFGAVFDSPTKPGATPIALNTLRHYARRIEKPVCAVGGISAQHAASVFDCGVTMIAAASGILARADPAAAVRRYLSRQAA